jgi:hypothetical protein
MELNHAPDTRLAIARAIADISAAEFRRQLAANGFAYVRQTRGFLDLRRNKRTRFERLVGVRDDRGRLKRRETIASLLASRMP